MSKIAIIGVNNNVGKEVLNLLFEDGLSQNDILALDVKTQSGGNVSFGDADLLVQAVETFDFSTADFAIFLAPQEVSKRYVSKASSFGLKIVDASSSSLSDMDVPMFLSGFNDDEVSSSSSSQGIVSVPCANVAQMLAPLANIHKDFQIKRIVVSTYNSVSVYGQKAMDELYRQTRKILMNDVSGNQGPIFKKQIAFNVLPQVEGFLSDETLCEWQMNVETKKILGADVKVHANCAIVPSFVGCGQYVNVECEQDVDIDEIAAIIRKTKGVNVFDNPEEEVYSCLNDAQGENSVFVSRLRQDVSVENGFSFWCVADGINHCLAGNVFRVFKKTIKN